MGRKSKSQKIDEDIANGLWVYDRTKGMPPISKPIPLFKRGDKPLTIDEISDYITYDGLGYCVAHFIHAKDIQDKKLSTLWEKARKALQEVWSYVQNNNSQIVGDKQK